MGGGATQSPPSRTHSWGDARAQPIPVSILCANVPGNSKVGGIRSKTPSRRAFHMGRTQRTRAWCGKKTAPCSKKCCLSKASTQGGAAKIPCIGFFYLVLRRLTETGRKGDCKTACGMKAFGSGQQGLLAFFAVRVWQATVNGADGGTLFLRMEPHAFCAAFRFDEIKVFAGKNRLVGTLRLAGATVDARLKNCGSHGENHPLLQAFGCVFEICPVLPRAATQAAGRFLTLAAGRVLPMRPCALPRHAVPNPLRSVSVSLRCREITMPSAS